MIEFYSVQACARRAAEILMFLAYAPARGAVCLNHWYPAD